MRKPILLTVSLLTCALTASCKGTADDYSPEKIIAMERGALDRWGKGDPQGYLEIMASDLTYFDPTRDKRLDGLGAMKEFLQPFTGKIRIDRYKKIGEIWLPESLRFELAPYDGSKTAWRKFEILFSALSLERIENKVFEIGQNAP